MFRKVLTALVVLVIFSGCTKTSEPEATPSSTPTQETPSKISEGNLAIWINFKTGLSPDNQSVCQEYFQGKADPETVGGPGRCGPWKMDASTQKCQTYQSSDIRIQSYQSWIVLRRDTVKQGEGAIRSEAASLDGDTLTCVFYTGIRGIPKTEVPVTLVYRDEVIGVFEVDELEELKWKLDLEIKLP